MKRIAAVLIPFGLFALGPAHAQHASHVAQAPAAAKAAASLADGEVRKIDKPAGKITLKHGELKSVGMGPMTMAFGVKDPGLLDKVKVGDKVKFAVEQKGSDLVVTAIETAK